MPNKPPEPTPFVILNGGGNPHTTLVLKDAHGSHELYGPVMSSKPRTSEVGTPQWIDQIFVSRNRDPEKAFEAAKIAAQKVLHTPPGDPYHAMGSSFCGLNATLHVVEEDEPVTIEVTRMITDPHLTVGGRPFIVAVSLWRDQKLMSSFDRASFNSIAALTCTEMREPEPKPI